MKVWFPTIRANTGADVFTINLVKGLNKNGIEAEIMWLPHLTEIFPYPLRYLKVPKDTDIIHTNSWNGFAFLKKNIPMVVSVFHWVHDDALAPYKTKAQKFYHNHFIKRYEKFSINRATVVSAISEYTGNQLKNSFPENNIKVIQTGINTNHFRPAIKSSRKDSFKLLFIGSPSKRKGFDLLLPIMENLPKDIVLYYTDGNLNGNENVIKLGRLSDIELLKLYQSCDALLFPTRYEGFGYVVAEAMACAKPVISSACSAVSELIKNNETGLLCPLDDTFAFSESIIRLSKDRDLCSRLGNNARNTIHERFNIDNMVNKYINLYKSLI